MNEFHRPCSDPAVEYQMGSARSSIFGLYRFAYLENSGSSSSYPAKKVTLSLGMLYKSQQRYESHMHLSLVEAVVEL